MCTTEDQVRCQAEQALLRDSRTSSFAAVASSENLVCNAAGRAFASGYVIAAVIKSAAVPVDEREIPGTEQYLYIRVQHWYEHV